MLTFNLRLKKEFSVGVYVTRITTVLLSHDYCLHCQSPDGFEKNGHRGQLRGTCTTVNLQILKFVPNSKLCFQFIVIRSVYICSLFGS